MVAFLIWWVVLTLIGLLALPITMRLLRFLPDRGLAFARQVGLLLVGYLFWFLVTVGLLQNTLGSLLFVLAGVGGVSLALWRREGAALWARLREHRGLILFSEVLFFLALGLFCLFRAYNPEITATEKPMEFGFINGILRSRTFPPRDPWLSGYAISYYYFGYVLIALLTTLSGLPSDVTFNLAGAMLFAFTVVGAFSVVYNLVQALKERRAAARGVVAQLISRGALLAGLLGSVLVALIGNLEGIFELIRARGGGSEALWRWLDVKNLVATPPSTAWYPTDPWWWWRASRVIHDRDLAGQSVEVIDEFPFFSFMLGDNHPHVLALPVVLLVLAIALNVLLSVRAHRAEVAPEAASEGKASWWASLRAYLGTLWEGGPFDLLLWALLVGSLGFLNTWDYPIYLGLLVLAYAIRRHAVIGRVSWAWLYDVAQVGALLLVVGVALYFPFYLSFRSQAGGIGFVGAIKTRLHQYLLMFGTPLYLVIGLLAALGVRYARVPRAARKLPLGTLVVGAAGLAGAAFALVQGWWTAALVLALLALSGALLLWGAVVRTGGEEPHAPLEPSLLFALLIAAAGLALTVSVEFVFLRDTFGTRMNTVFKFYYQGWVLLALAGAFGAYYVVEQLLEERALARVGLAVWSLVAVALVGAGLSYTVAAAVSKAEGFRSEPTLDGTRYVERYRKDDYDAIQWLRAHAREGAVMVEATGGSYSEYNWVSAHTGIPTLLGWGGHELQWRGNYDLAGKREQDIPALYQGTDATKALQLLDKYNVDYVYIGRLERDKYRLNQAMINKFGKIMDKVYDQGNVIIYARAR